MFILINGAFGPGKTTTTARCSDRCPVRFYDPEPVGVALQRASAFLRPGGRIDDFQNLASWQLLTAWGARWRRRNCVVVIVPMAFSNQTYLEALAEALVRRSVVHTLCLVASPEVIRERLRRRAESERTPVDRWALERAVVCCEAHRSSAFGHPVDATASTGEIVQSICELAALQ